jgi:predicted Rossmann fold flavoprotein
VHIAVIGAGPAGMMAALMAARKGARVTLFDSNPGVGRKLLVTGSGRCNLTNAAAEAQRYICDDTGRLECVFKVFNRSDLLAFLEEIGILTTHTADGWYYPLSDSAATVVEAFAAALAEAGVELRLKHHVLGFSQSGAGWQVNLVRDMVETFDRLVLAFGGKAHPELGSTGALFPALAALGHSVLPLRPALAPLEVDLGWLKPLQGVRLDLHTSVRLGKTILAETTGNCIITEWGLNGPGVMDISHAVSAHRGEKLTLEVNLLPAAEADVRALLKRKRSSNVPIKVLLGSALPPKVGPAVLLAAEIPTHALMVELGDTQIEKAVRALTQVELPVKGIHGGFNFCHVAAGGVPLRETEAGSMASLRCAGLYLCGEVLDVTGPCGGYNLQYAFSSGAAAGMAAGQIS